MTENEIGALTLGIQIGMLLMLITQIIGSAVDDRRDRRVARTVLKRSAGDLYLSSFRRYQLRERSRV